MNRFAPILTLAHGITAGLIGLVLVGEEARRYADGATSLKELTTPMKGILEFMNNRSEGAIAVVILLMFRSRSVDIVVKNFLEKVGTDETRCRC